MEPLKAKPEFADPKNEYYSYSSNGLKRAYCEFTVTDGEYAGVHFRQSITLPMGEQDRQLTQGQQISARIGGAQFKAICEAANRPLKMISIAQLNGCMFPVKVRISNRPTEKDGRVYWNNEIDQIITPSMNEYTEVKQKRELINENGPVKGDGTATPNGSTPQNSRGGFGQPQYASNSDIFDTVPFN